MNFDKDYSPKHIQNLSRDEASINLFSDIGGENGIQGQSFADEMTFLNEREVKTINIHLASDGGSVSEGLIIYHSILGSKAFVNIFIEGVAASMGGIIAMAGDRVHMTDASQLMIHNPWSGGDPEDDKIKNALNALRDSLLVTINNRAKISEGKISTMMNNETWISPTDALQMGLIDEVLPTKKRKKQSKEAKDAVNEIFNKLNSNNINNKNNNMKDIAKHYGLSEDANEAAILKAAQKESAALETSKNDLATAKDELTESKAKVKELNDKVTEFEASAETIEATIVEETIDKAIDEGTFAKEDKESLVLDYAGNAVGLKSILSKIKVSAPNVIAKLNGKSVEGSESKLPESLKGKTYFELFKEGNIEQVRNIDEAEFFALYKQEYSLDHPDFIAA